MSCFLARIELEAVLIRIVARSITSYVNALAHAHGRASRVEKRKNPEKNRNVGKDSPEIPNSFCHSILLSS